MDGLTDDGQDLITPLNVEINPRFCMYDLDGRTLKPTDEWALDGAFYRGATSHHKKKSTRVGSAAAPATSTAPAPVRVELNFWV